MSGERVFVDTNIIVYAYDRDAGGKHEIATNLLIDLWNTEGGVISTQVLQEFYVTVTKKIASPLASDSAREIIADFLTWDVVANDGEAVLAAIDLHVSEKISFWDALIVAAAEKGGADILVSEDLSDGRKFGNVAVRNPFAHTRRARGV
jgi:predicted nucleic acid-binding protein